MSKQKNFQRTTARLMPLIMAHLMGMSFSASAEEAPPVITKAPAEQKMSPLDYKAGEDGIIRMVKADLPISSTIGRSEQNRNVVILAMGALGKDDENSSLHKAFEIKKEYEGRSRYGDDIKIEIVAIQGSKERLAIAAAGSVISVKNLNSKLAANGVFTLENVDIGAKKIPATFRATTEDPAVENK